MKRRRAGGVTVNNRTQTYIIIAVLVFGALAGCMRDTKKTLQATGGSRADGVVELSYTSDWLERPQVDWAQGKRTASKHCRAWGYKHAEVFAGQTSRCQKYWSDGDCKVKLFTVRYQCISN